MRKYNTKQREMILDRFTKNPSICFSAKEICDQCEYVGQATVYRTLATLEKEGVILRFHGHPGGDVFKLACDRNDDRHIHIVCKSCGDMIHSDCDFINEISAHLESCHSFRLDTSSTVIYGFCEKCTEEGL